MSLLNDGSSSILEDDRRSSFSPGIIDIRGDRNDLEINRYRMKNAPECRRAWSSLVNLSKTRLCIYGECSIDTKELSTSQGNILGRSFLLNFRATEDAVILHVDALGRLQWFVRTKGILRRILTFSSVKLL